eukprot:TRINITY_DN2828_c0_g1_i2.p1 TRINITY_DN2828_c0_g1~~TRINITY_DN2828_c0_g1_i2.p1  ORF type:complete len:131 (-),score=15.43 TRINITY_DN2828_c0_g1_i2:39-431(-)
MRTIHASIWEIRTKIHILKNTIPIIPSIQKATEFLRLAKAMRQLLTPISSDIKKKIQEKQLTAIEQELTRDLAQLDDPETPSDCQTDQQTLQRHISKTEDLSQTQGDTQGISIAIDGLQHLTSFFLALKG